MWSLVFEVLFLGLSVESERAESPQASALFPIEPVRLVVASQLSSAVA